MNPLLLEIARGLITQERLPARRQVLDGHEIHPTCVPTVNAEEVDLADIVARRHLRMWMVHVAAAGLERDRAIAPESVP
jgi:hypothetical protein